MSSEKKVPSAEEGTVQWLEGQLQQARLQVQRLEYRLEEAVNQLQTLIAGSRKLEESLNAANSQVDLLPTLQEEVRRAKDQLGRLQDRLTAGQNRAEEFVRQRQSELERERQERTTLAKRVDAVEKVIGRYENRMQAIDDALRHSEEEAASLRQAQQHLSHPLDELATKANRSVDALVRIEQQLNRLANEVQNLGQSSAALADQVNLAHEIVRRAEQRVDRVEQQFPTVEVLQEQYKSIRSDRETMSERAANLERGLEEAKELAGQMNHLLEIVRQRTEQQGVQLLSLTEELRSQHQQVTENLRRALVVLERQKRRQVEALGQEIKELKKSDLTLGQQ